MGKVKIPPPWAHVRLHTAIGNEGNSLYMVCEWGNDHWLRALSREHLWWHQPQLNQSLRSSPQSTKGMLCQLHDTDCKRNGSLFCKKAKGIKTCWPQSHLHTINAHEKRQKILSHWFTKADLKEILWATNSPAELKIWKVLTVYNTLVFIIQWSSEMQTH